MEPPGGEDEAGVVVKTEPRDGSGDDGDVSPGGSMSLDVLAQVASDRLEREPRRRREVSVIQRKTKVGTVSLSLLSGTCLSLLSGVMFLSVTSRMNLLLFLEEKSRSTIKHTYSNKQHS